ncbi:DNA-processing protein DprA [Vibrio sp. TRT 17S01]
MNQQELSAWLTLHFTPGLGPKTISKLRSANPLTKIVASNATILRSMGLKEKQIAFIHTQADALVTSALQWLDAMPDRHIITLESPEYPPLLKQIPAAPPVLFVQGQIECLIQPQIGIVGSRNASIDGQQAATHFAGELVEQNMIVTSGLALGIDGFAHDGALRRQGKTIAVLGSGLNHIYPARHKKLAQRILENGALISEFHPDTKPRPENFPRRNRIISGLSMGVLVVEAAEKSGSLITARYAAEQSREVFVVPGSIHNVMSRGSNLLIKQGACLVQNIEDILNEIDHLLEWSKSVTVPIQASLFEQIDSKEELPFPQLLANVGSKATPVDILASRTHIPVQEVMMQLLELELLGHVVAVSGGYIRKGRG